MAKFITLTEKGNPNSFSIDINIDYIVSYGPDIADSNKSIIRTLGGHSIKLSKTRLELRIR
jgi:hypothetical protein